MKILFFLIFLFPAVIFAQSKHPLTVDDLWAMKRIGSFDLSPDGKQIVFDVTAYSMEENKGNSDIYLVNIDGSNLHPLKNSDKNETNPKFSPDGKKISYLIDDQIHTCNLDGSEDIQLTDLYTGINDYRWSHDGKKLLLISNVYPDCGSQDCNKKVDEEKKQSKVNVKILTHLMFRYWNRWLKGKRSHLFLFNTVS
ncbi:MAG: DPP IV N-terminal domain-containing protein, partial [Ignavibacteriaceae bacterium]